MMTPVPLNTYICCSNHLWFFSPQNILITRLRIMHSTTVILRGKCCGLFCLQWVCLHTMGWVRWLNNYRLLRPNLIEFSPQDAQMEEVNQLQQVVLWPSPISVTCSCTAWLCMHTHAISKVQKNKPSYKCFIKAHTAHQEQGFNGEKTLSPTKTTSHHWKSLSPSKCLTMMNVRKWYWVFRIWLSGLECLTNSSFSALHLHRVQRKREWERSRGKDDKRRRRRKRRRRNRKKKGERRSMIGQWDG